MFVSSSALKLVCEFSLVGMVGLVAMLAFVVLTVDRLNVRLSELEAQLADRRPPEVLGAAAGIRRGDGRGSDPTLVRPGGGLISAALLCDPDRDECGARHPRGGATTARAVALP